MVDVINWEQILPKTLGAVGAKDIKRCLQRGAVLSCVYQAHSCVEDSVELHHRASDPTTAPLNVPLLRS